MEKASYETDKSFVLEMIRYAQELSGQQSVWEKLGYEPKQEYLEYALNSFEALIKQMSLHDIDENNLKEWLSAAEKNEPVKSGFPQWSKHGVHSVQNEYFSVDIIHLL